MGLMSALAALQTSGPPIGGPDMGSFGGLMDSSPPSDQDVAAFQAHQDDLRRRGILFNGGLQDYSSNWTAPKGPGDNAPGGAPPGGPVDTGEDPSDPMAMYHQRVLDYYDQIQKAQQARVTALQAMQQIQQPKAQQLQISPLQAILATLGAGIAGSSDRMNGSQIAGQALSGFMSNAEKRNDVVNSNNQIGYQNALRAANINSEIAGEGVNVAQTGLAKAQTEEYRQRQLDEKRVNGVMMMIDKMVSPTQTAKLGAPGNDPQMYFDRLNKLYQAARMPQMMLTPTEISAAVDGVNSRIKAEGDAKAEQKNAEIGQRIYSAAMANPSSPRTRAMLTIAKGYFPANSSAQQQIDDQISNVGMSMGEQKQLTDAQRISVQSQLKGVDKQLDSLEKDLRGSQVSDPAKVDAYLKLGQQRSMLAQQLAPPPPPTPNPTPNGTSAVPSAGGFQITLPPGGAPLPNGALVPTPTDKVAAGPKAPKNVGGPSGRETLSDFDRKQWDNAHSKIVSLKTIEIPNLESQVSAAKASALGEQIGSAVDFMGKQTGKTPNADKASALQVKLDSAKGELQRWVQRAEAILPGSVMPRPNPAAAGHPPGTGPGPSVQRTKSGNAYVPG